MASWQEGRFITDWTDRAEVAKLLALMPIQEAGSLSTEELLSRRVDLYNVFGIGAVARDGGVEYQPGVGPDDQPLLAALEELFERRFPATPRER